MKNGGFASLAIAVLLLAPRSFSATANDTLAENQAKWRAHRPERYAFTYTLRCFCIIPKVLVEAHGDSVVRVTDLDANGFAKPEANPQYYSMDSIFARMRVALDRKPGYHAIRYNDPLGYPDSAYFDGAALVSDDEYTETITEFEDLSVAIRRPPPPHARLSGFRIRRDLSGRAVLRHGAGPVFE